jgi:hypothetical protein
MPAKMVRCRKCRTLLNTDLDPDSVEIPQFVPLQELDSYQVIQPIGCYLLCPHCDTELRVGVKYIGQGVACNHCKGVFKIDPASDVSGPRGFYCDCPQCKQRLRLSKKYIDIKVSCKFCGCKVVMAAPNVTG